MEWIILSIITSIILLLTSLYLRLELNRKIKTFEEVEFNLHNEIDHLKKELSKPKSQEFINFLSDFNRGGAILSIEPINKDDIYFHKSGK